MVVKHFMGRTYVRTEASPGVPFDLTCTTSKRGRVRVNMRFSILYSGPGISEDDYGLACEVSGRVNGVDVIAETVGMGNRLHAPVDRVIRSFSWVNSGSVLGKHALNATVVLADLGMLEEGAPIQFRGTVSCEEHTQVGSMKLWIGS
jgi:hypothetical protein